MFTKCSVLANAAGMPSLLPERLRQFALDALEEALAEAERGPVRRTWALRLTLAYLSSLHPRNWSASEPYRDFWRALSVDRKSIRLRNLEQALAVIYAWADVRRDRERAAIIRDRAHHEALDRRRDGHRVE